MREPLWYLARIYEEIGSISQTVRFGHVEDKMSKRGIEESLNSNISELDNLFLGLANSMGVELK